MDTGYNFNSKNIDDDIYAFIGSNQEYFLRKFEKLSYGNIKISWNWASAFWGAYWYAYRKMYLIQFLYYVIYLFTLVFWGMLMSHFHSFLIQYMFTPIFVVIPLVILMIPFVISGVFGDYIYQCHVEKHVNRAQSMENYKKENYLMKKGGTSGCALLILICISLLLKILI